jgi:hypothetical protein
VWHASVSPIGNRPTPQNTARLFEVAKMALRDVGAATLGEWREVGEKAVHLRRRLSLEEAAPIGEARDLRGSTEARRRLWRASQWMPPRYLDLARAESEETRNR